MKTTYEFKVEISAEDEHLTPDEAKLLKESITPLAIKRLLLDSFEMFDTFEFVDSDCLTVKVTKAS